MAGYSYIVQIYHSSFKADIPCSYWNYIHSAYILAVGECRQAFDRLLGFEVTTQIINGCLWQAQRAGQGAKVKMLKNQDAQKCFPRLHKSNFKSKSNLFKIILKLTLSITECLHSASLNVFFLHHTDNITWDCIICVLPKYVSSDSG